MQQLQTNVLIEGLVDLVKRRVLEELNVVARQDDFVDQHSTPLGKRTHCKLVRTLAAKQHPGAAVLGRRLLLSRAAIAEYMAGLNAPTGAAKAPPTAGERLEAELRSLHAQ